MTRKSSISKAGTYREIGEFWDKHDSTDFGEQVDVDFDINIGSQKRYYPIDGFLSTKIKKMAQERGISEETLLNLWVQEKLDQTEDEQPT